MLRRAQFISDEEYNLLKFSLRIDNDARIIKRALQSLCVHYEANRLLKNSYEIRPLIHSHLGSDHVLLRRWSLKALGLIRDPDDAPRIADRLRVESDQEALTWGTAALLSSSSTHNIRDIVKKSHLNSDVPLLLAARLYASESWIKKNPQTVVVSLDDEELILKWALFLVGYNKAPGDLFSERHDNSVFLGALNQHDSPEITEYSVWALHERPEFDYSHSRIPIDAIQKRPENVRKWLYRLLLKSQEITNLEPDHISDLALDRSSVALEGLAQGVADLKGREYDDVLLTWFLREKSITVQEMLLESIARRGDVSEEFTRLIIERFESAAVDSGIRKKLLAASEKTPFFLKLKKRDTLDMIAKEGLAQYGLGFDFVTKAGMTVNQNKIVVHGNLNAQNVSAGDMIGSANGAVQNIQANRASDKEVLAEVLKFLEDSNISQGHKKTIAGNVQAVAETPSVENKKGLFESVKKIGEALAVTGGSIEGLDKIIDLTSSLLS